MADSGAIAGHDRIEDLLKVRICIKLTRSLASGILRGPVPLSLNKHVVARKWAVTSSVSVLLHACNRRPGPCCCDSANAKLQDQCRTNWIRCLPPSGSRWPRLSVKIIAQLYFRSIVCCVS